MGVGPSRVGPITTECDDVSFKSDDENTIHKKKTGIVQSIMDALLGEKPISPDDLGCVSFSESPNSGTDFEFEDTFVDAPLPSTRQHGPWKEAKPERKSTPGRARAKRRNIASKFSTISSTDEQLLSSSNQEGEVMLINPDKDESKLVKSDVQAKSSKMSETSQEIPSSHDRGDHATSTAPTNPKVDDIGCPNRVMHQEPKAHKIIDNPCSFQNNNNSVDIPLTAQKGKKIQATVVKTSDVFALESDGITDIASGGAATSKVKRGLNKQTHDDSKTGVTIKGKTSIDSNTVNNSVKSDGPEIPADGSGALSVLPHTITKRTKRFKRAKALIPKQMPQSRAKEIADFFDKKRADIFRVEKEKRDSAVPCADGSEVNVAGKKETQTDLGKEVPTVNRLFQTQVPRSAHLNDAIAEARKELDSIQKFITGSDKRPQISTMATKQVPADIVEENGSSTPSQSKGSKFDTSISNQRDGRKNPPLLCPTFDEDLPKRVVFDGKKVANTVQAELKPIDHRESDHDLKTSPPSTDGEKTKDGTNVSKQRITFTRTRNLLRRKTTQKQNKPSGANKNTEPPSVKESEDAFRPSTPAVPIKSAVECQATRVDKNASMKTERPSGSRIPTVCRGSGPSNDITVQRKMTLFSEQSRKIVVIERRIGPPEPSVNPFEPNELLDAFRDGNMHSVAMTYQRSLTRDAVNSLVRYLPHILQSREKYVSRSCPADLRRLETTKVSDRDLDSMFQESLTWWERRRPGVLFNTKFYPQRLFLPYFDKIGNDIELSSKNYHVHGVQYLPVFVNWEDIEDNPDKVETMEGRIHPDEKTTEKPRGKYDLGLRANHVLRFTDHSKTSVRFAKQHLINVLAELNRVVITFLQSRSSNGWTKSEGDKSGKVLYWYKELTKLSKRMDVMETDLSKNGTTDDDSSTRDQMLHEYHRVLREFDEWKDNFNSGKESLLSAETKPVIKLAVKPKGGENKKVLPIPIPVQRVDNVEPLPAESTKPSDPPTFFDSKEEPRTDTNGNKMEKDIQVEIDSKDQTEVKKDGEVVKSEVSNDHDAKNTTTTATVSKDESKQIGEVSKSFVDKKQEQINKSKTKAQMNNQIVSGNGDSTAEGAKEGQKRKLGRGPRIIGDVRRIVHCQRRRRTDTPTTQLKVKFCLGCGDTKQPNGEALIQCGTCDEAFFCCSKCQRATRNEHRETCKGVKRHYCRHW